MFELFGGQPQAARGKGYRFSVQSVDVDRRCGQAVQLEEREASGKHDLGSVVHGGGRADLHGGVGPGAGQAQTGGH
eukprot:6211161-Pleurochrysis_carterae.AAC.2